MSIDVPDNKNSFPFDEYEHTIERVMSPEQIGASNRIIEDINTWFSKATTHEAVEVDTIDFTPDGPTDVPPEVAVLDITSMRIEGDGIEVPLYTEIHRSPQGTDEVIEVYSDQAEQQQAPSNDRAHIKLAEYRSVMYLAEATEFDDGDESGVYDAGSAVALGIRVMGDGSTWISMDGETYDPLGDSDATEQAREILNDVLREFVPRDM